MSIIDGVVQPSVIRFRGDEGSLFEMITKIGKQNLQKNASFQGTYTVNPFQTYVDREPWKKQFYPIAQNLNGIAKQNGESARVLTSAFVIFSLKDTYLATEIADFLSAFNDVVIHVNRQNPEMIITGTNPIKYHSLK